MKIFKVLSTAVICILMLSRVGVMAAESWKVIVSNQNFIINGEAVEVSALNVNGRNYIPVTEIAELLDIGVSFDADTNTVYLEKEELLTDITTSQNLPVDVEPVRTVDVTDRISDRHVAHVIEIDIPRLYPQQHIVLDDMLELQNGDIVTYDISFGDVRSGVMVAFVPDRTWESDNQVYCGMIFDSISTVEPGRMYFEAPIGFSLDEAYLILRNQHPTDSSVAVENIKGTVTISRADWVEQ